MGVDELADWLAGGTRGGHVLERVVVCAGLEPDLLPTQPSMPGQHVGLDQLERMSQVRRTVDVGDGRGEGETLAVHGLPFRPPRDE